MTSITEATLYSDIRSMLNEPTPLIWTNTELLAWIDQAARIIGAVTLSRELTVDDAISSTTGPTVEQTAYALLDSSIEEAPLIDAIIYYGSTTNTASVHTSALIKVHPRVFDNVVDDTEDYPKFWTVINETVYIWPPPKLTINDHVFQILYHDNVDEYFLAATTYYLRDELQEYVIWYAVAKAFEKVGKYAQSEQYMSIFNSFISFHRQDRLPKPVDSLEMMNVPDRTQMVQ